MVEGKLCLENNLYGSQQQNKSVFETPSNLPQPPPAQNTDKRSLQGGAAARPGLGLVLPSPRAEAAALPLPAGTCPSLSSCHPTCTELDLASQGTGGVSSPGLTLNTSSRHQLEAFMLTALGDRKQRNTLLTINVTQGIGSEINSSSIFVTIPEK